MPTGLIRLAPMEKFEPLLGSMPFDNAQRWRSPYENASNQPPVNIFVVQSAFTRACAHAGSDLINEVGGWLIGSCKVDQDSGETFIVVEKTMAASHIRHGSAYLTFTQDSQVAMHAEMEARYPEKDIVGWYHTHPRMGIFLSQYDTWLHTHFFPHPWQVALVIEPHSAIGGFFITQEDGWLDPKQYYGFYEITERKGRSVVHWSNLLPNGEV